jgi:HxlR-like helix-turn-helix
VDQDDGVRRRRSTRLRKLEQAGVIGRRRHSEHPPHYGYLLADAGREPLRDGELTVTGGTHPVQATM